MTASLTPLASLWMPEQASTYAGDIDWAFYFVLWISVFFTLLITGLVLFFAIRRWDGGLKGAQHGHGGRGRMGKGPTHNTALEMTWTVIPLLLVIAIFIFGFRPFLHIATPPDDAYEVLVQAQKWSWSFKYPNGAFSPDGKLHVPAGVPIRVVLSVPSGDVIHSFYVPAFRTKQDAVPGRYNKTWFEAVWRDGAAEPLEVGEGASAQTFQVNRYPLYCTEYCGQGHSDMLSEVVVHPDEAAFANWLKTAAGDVEPTAEVGKRLIETRGACIQCHSATGDPGIGPTFKDAFGAEHEMADGSTVTVDEDYIRESILDPQARIVAGFPKPSPMPSYQGLLDDNDIQAIIAYLKSISQHAEQHELGTDSDGTSQ